MKIKINISEPWEIPDGWQETLIVTPLNGQQDDLRWQVALLEGYPKDASIQFASVQPRYENETLKKLKKGESLFVNVTVKYIRNVQDFFEGFIGTAVVIE